MSQHHPEGPSLHPAFSECARFEAEREIDDLEGGEAAPETEQDNNKARGTAQHKACALYIAGAPDWDAGLSFWERANVEWVSRRVIEIAASFGYDRSEIRCEVRVEVYGPLFDPLCFGTLDFTFGPVVLDAKFGLERNYFPQLSSYALAQMQAANALRWYVGVVYGMGRRSNIQPVSRETCQTVTWGIMAKRRNPASRPTPCSYCGWCARRMECEAFTAAPLAIESAPQWASLFAAAKSAPTNVRLGLLRHISKAYLEPFIQRTEEECFAHPGVTPLGFTASKRAGRGSIADASKAVAALKDSGVRDSDLVAVAPFSFSTLLAAYRFRYPDASEEDTRKSVLEILGDNYTPGEQGIQFRRQKDSEQQLIEALNIKAL